MTLSRHRHQGGQFALEDFVTLVRKRDLLTEQYGFPLVVFKLLAQTSHCRIVQAFCACDSLRQD